MQAFGATQAEWYLRELDAVFGLIGEQPQIGSVHEGRTRHFIHGRHIIVYRVLAEEVVIGRILHGAQSWRPGA